MPTLELFQKHLDFVGLQLSLEHKPHEKYLLHFDDANTQKHWLSFWATYNKGYNEAINQMIVPLAQALKG